MVQTLGTRREASLLLQVYSGFGVEHAGGNSDVNVAVGDVSGIVVSTVVAVALVLPVLSELIGAYLLALLTV